MLPSARDRPCYRGLTRDCTKPEAEPPERKYDRLCLEVQQLQAQLAKKQWELHDTWRQITIREIKHY